MIPEMSGTLARPIYSPAIYLGAAAVGAVMGPAWNLRDPRRCSIWLTSLNEAAARNHPSVHSANEINPLSQEPLIG
jgi:hypothetical protein